MTDFRERLKEKVKEKYGTYTEFVEKIGIQLSYFSRILSGERTPSYSFFKKLADLGFDLNYLFKGEPEEKQLIKEEKVPYLIDAKIETLQNFVYRIDDLFEEINSQEIDLNIPQVTISTNQLVEFIELLKELASFVDETLLENQELHEKLLQPNKGTSAVNIQKMKDQTTLLISKLNEELKHRRVDTDSNSLN